MVNPALLGEHPLRVASTAAKEPLAVHQSAARNDAMGHKRPNCDCRMMSVVAPKTDMTCAVMKPRLVPVERHQRAHRHAKLPDFVGAAEVRQIDDETGGEHLGTHLP
jgi:hypothetical protein